MKNINVQTIKTSEKTFFLVWLKIMQSFLKLGKQEQLVLARLLYYRYVISLDVKNDTIVSDLTMSTNTRKQIKKDLDLDTASFNNTLSILRRKKMIINNTINPKVIPRVQPGFKNFKLVYDININEVIQK
tara:strand:- start:291 stop:680 length:390 start_codon:yes stop_codon:yes gene_type:complete